MIKDDFKFSFFYNIYKRWRGKKTLQTTSNNYPGMLKTPKEEGISSKYPRISRRVLSRIGTIEAKRDIKLSLIEKELVRTVELWVTPRNSVQKDQEE